MSYIRKYYFLVICLMISQSSICQRLFQVEKNRRIDISLEKTNDKDTASFFRILPVPAVAGKNISYPLTFPENINTVKAIGELLAYEGDSRFCALPVMSYNPAVSELYIGSCNTYSLQIEALFIINQLVYEKRFNYASYPILQNKRTNKMFSIAGSTISIAFKAYKRWYSIVKKKGLKYVQDNNINPLDGSSVRWY